MKELSKQICEICGIPYAVFMKHNLTNAAIKTYLNFSRPENFVKLLEIISRKAGVLFCHNGTYFGCSIHYGFDETFEAVEGDLAKNFLNTLLVQHCRNSYYPKLLELDEIKQAIKEANWKYD